MVVYDVATKVIDTEIFPQGNIAGLISGTFCVVQSGEVFMVKGNKHIHTRTHTHTHTHTHAHTHAHTHTRRY